VRPQAEAELEHSVRQFTGAGVTESLGEHLTCNEAEALAQILVIGGELEAARQLLEGHILSDEDGDMHYGVESAELKATEIIDACRQLAAM
jgi:hypothetical protein